MLILEHYIIHKSRKTLARLKHNSKSRLPVYSPWVYKIERLWLAMHETLRRNHCCKTMRELLCRGGDLWKRFHYFLAAGPAQQKCDSIRNTHLVMFFILSKYSVRQFIDHNKKVALKINFLVFLHLLKLYLYLIVINSAMDVVSFINGIYNYME